jgi:type VI secretion system protein ImpF
MPPSTPPRLLPSILDRLVDTESMGGRVAGYDHRQMMDAVRADMEELLNAKLTCQDLPAEFEETAKSIVAFGLPDLSSIDASDKFARDGLARAVADTIRLFEPRLRNVRVLVVDDKTKLMLSLKFKIEAELNVDPAPEVGFETVLELTTGRATVATPRTAG